jgi:tripartite-type tricarboxylate transporter receptor subunit TctC
MRVEMNAKSRWKIFYIVLVPVFLAVFALTCFAEEKYPSRPINLYIPFPPGGNIDLTARPLAEAASKILGRPIIPVNKPGATGSLAPAAVMSIKPDGYNLCVSLNSILYFSVMKDVPYDPLKSFIYICRNQCGIFGIVVKADSPWQTFQDLVQYSKANPGKIKYATAAFGGTPHLAMAEVAIKEGIQWEVIPFPGGPQVTSCSSSSIFR